MHLQSLFLSVFSSCSSRCSMFSSLGKILLRFSCISLDSSLTSSVSAFTSRSTISAFLANSSDVFCTARAMKINTIPPTKVIAKPTLANTNATVIASNLSSYAILLTVLPIVTQTFDLCQISYSYLYISDSSTKNLTHITGYSTTSVQKREILPCPLRINRERRESTRNPAPHSRIKTADHADGGNKPRKTRNKRKRVVRIEG